MTSNLPWCRDTLSQHHGWLFFRSQDLLATFPQRIYLLCGASLHRWLPVHVTLDQRHRSHRIECRRLSDGHIDIAEPGCINLQHHLSSGMRHLRNPKMWFTNLIRCNRLSSEQHGTRFSLSHFSFWSVMPCQYQRTVYAMRSRSQLAS